MQIRGELDSGTRLALGVSGVGAVLLLWVLLTLGENPIDRVMTPLILPSPGEVLAAFKPLHFDQGLNRSVLMSLARVTAGFLLAALVALPLGVAMAVDNRVRGFFRPLVSVSAYVPIPALVPLSIAWFGIGEEQKVLFLAFAIFIGLLPMVVAALDQVDDIFLKTGFTLGAGAYETVAFIMLPVAAPGLWDALRTMYGVGWSWIILAEVVDAQSGLGFLIQSSQRRSHMDQVYAVLLVIVGIAVLIDAGFRFAGRVLFPYEEA